MNSNNGLWLLIILLLLGSGALSSRAFTGCGWPFLIALAYCTYKNGTLSEILNTLGGNNGCGCNG